ncbi:GPN-loop GTPase 2 [Lingula anatina]|uniref:GPN-loop GTPase 2 n=1 Tax=Lingula anatina TaxID=7574 RepID=A0A1S3JVM4_LINAN|nr:GPN-loop GTPase 2 [Lingula anatina]|eukprot:XP_013414423.1 GPN-loop GTPase 2 [Lingula anatina]
MFGQVVIGPPGSGKTTYCAAMQEFLTAMGRKVAVINLDPANDILPYKCQVNIAELITLSDVMDSLKLGPNGGLIYCMEFLERNMDWLHSKVSALKDSYLLFDCPGQVELYTHDDSVKKIFGRLTKLDYRLTAVHMVDSFYCSEASKFVSVLLTSLSTMLQCELPHVNVLSKADLIQKYGQLAFHLDFYTDVLDLSYLLEHLQEDPFFSKYRKLNEALVSVVEDYSLVSFVALNIKDRDCMLRVIREVDKANGYVFGDMEERSIQELLSCAVGAEFEYEKIQTVAEKYMGEQDEDNDSDVEQKTLADLLNVE